MSLTGILLGLINIAIVVAILILIGYIAIWIFNAIGFAIPEQVAKIYMVIVALIALYMIVALLLGIPTWRIVRHEGPPIGAYIPPVPDIVVANGKR